MIRHRTVTKDTSDVKDVTTTPAEKQHLSEIQSLIQDSMRETFAFNVKYSVKTAHFQILAAILSYILVTLVFNLLKISLRWHIVVPLTIGFFFVFSSLWCFIGDLFPVSSSAKYMENLNSWENFSKEYNNNPAHFWVAVTSENEVVGTIAVTIPVDDRFDSPDVMKMCSNPLQLHHMTVKRNFRGQEIGYTLLQHVMKFAKEQSFKENSVDGLVLATGYPVAVKFYEKNGFKHAEKCSCYYIGGLLKVTVFTMAYTF
ncbi:unnamed protein product [Clavelina lepadiformis]|uniref:N-acetyltransferase domain-containing protein n=1 Tax=Clavelina lepadiformis TaxID=159417 RepID=A0ABP0GW59_CLALP